MLRVIAPLPGLDAESAVTPHTPLLSFRLTASPLARSILHSVSMWHFYHFFTFMRFSIAPLETYGLFAYCIVSFAYRFNVLQTAHPLITPTHVCVSGSARL